MCQGAFALPCDSIGKSCVTARAFSQKIQGRAMFLLPMFAYGFSWHSNGLKVGYIVADESVVISLRLSGVLLKVLALVE